MKFRSFLSGLVAVVVVLLLIGIVGFYWITAQSPLKLLAKGEGKIPSAAIFVPKQAPVMLSLLVNPKDLVAFRQVVAAPSRRKQARTELSQFRQSLLGNTGLDYDRDVQPWLGDEVTLAITTLDIDRDRSNGKQPGYLLAIATHDPEQSREFLQLFWQKRAIAGTDLTFEQYKGVKLIYNEVPVNPKLEGKKPKKNQDFEFLTPASLLPAPTLASAVVGNQFVLFANDPKVLRDAITNVQAAELNLNNAQFYTQALETLTQPRIGLTFVNLPGLAGWLETEAITHAKDKPGTVEQGATTKGYQTLAIALELDRRGLLAETAMTGVDTKAAIAPALSKPVGALQYLPTLSPLVASGTNLDRVWRELSTSLSSFPTVSQLINQPLQALEKEWKLNLPQDVFSWVTGEYALGSLPPQAITNGEQTTPGKKRKPKRETLTELAENDWVFVAERNKENASQHAIAQLDEIAKKQGYSVGAVQLGEHTVSAWTKLTPSGLFSKTLQAEVQGVHTTVGNYELFATSLPALQTALDAVNNSLVNDDRFQQAIAPLQHPNNGYLYLDWNESRPLLERRFPFLKVIELAGSPLFNHLQSLTLSSYGRNQGIQRGAIFLKLG
ncbi:Protein of unknown function (DUF3352) [Leptolyngbyaceae cyanobacterium JSC-12]|nr:Protein of unknown function (DUF3352) [Leptolyngbyaceae cyanobacterium JSC-12]